MQVNRHVLIPAGGSGSRMGSELPKQFMLLAGKPILVHTIGVFVKAIPDVSIVLVLPNEFLGSWTAMQREYFPDVDIQTINGGPTRFHSVKNGLALLPNIGTVAIHDAVRPFATQSLVEACFTIAEQHGSGIAAIEPKDSIFELQDEKVVTVNRTLYRLAQTPQCFSLPKVKLAFQQDYTPAFTDDASVFQAAGGQLHLVPGENSNVKITTPEDLQFAESLLGAK